MLTPGFARAVDDELAAHPPERMLHALGQVRPDGSLLLSHWIPDLDADASGVHVRASPAGQAAVQAAERDHGVTYLGVVHSHPTGVPDPSGQDGHAVADLLALNPHLPVALVGVVVAATTDRDRAHVLDVGHGELVLHAMTRECHQLAPATLGVADPAPDFWAGAAARLPVGALDALHQAHATLVGAGSLGSTAAEQLVRAGIPRITLIDPDWVEVHNLSRTTYQLADVGRYKVDALADRLRAINPHVQIDTHIWPVDPSAHAKLADIVADSTVVLGLADAPRALALLDAVLHEQDTPGVFAGVYRGAVGADIITVLPGLTACYRCTVAPRVEVADLAPGIDYTTGRIAGAVALGVDVTTIAVLTARTALAVIGLLRGTDPLLEAPAVAGRNFLQIGLAPGFFDDTALFNGVPGQHAWQTLWARATGDPDCDRCTQADDQATPRSTDAIPATATVAPGTPAGADLPTTTPGATGDDEMAAVPDLAVIARLTRDWAHHHATHTLAPRAHAVGHGATRHLRHLWTRTPAVLRERHTIGPWQARVGRPTTRGDSHDRS